MSQTSPLSPMQDTLRLRKGQRLFQQGRVEPALAIFQQMVKSHPKDGTAQLWTGLCLSELCQWSQAQAAFQAAVDLDPRDPVRQAFLARSWLDLGQPRKSLDLLRSLAEGSPRSEVIAAGLYGVALLHNGQIQAGCEQLMRLPQPIRPLWLTARILAACELHLLEHLDAASSLDKNIVCDRPSGWFDRLSDAWQGLNLRARMRLRPRRVETRQDLALFQAEQNLKAGLLSAAVAALEPLQHVQIDDLNRLVRYIRLLLMIRADAAALSLAENALSDPRWKDASILRVLQALGLLALHRAAEALTILTNVYTKGGKFAFVEYNLGLCQLAEAGANVSAEEQAAVRARFARAAREYTLYNQTDICRLRLEELAHLAASAGLP